MNLAFEVRAQADLHRIEIWLSERNPAGATNVISDIMRALHLLLEQPRMGRALPRRAVRIWITRRYRYAIVYRIAGETLMVRAIYHPRRNRPF